MVKFLRLKTYFKKFKWQGTTNIQLRRKGLKFKWIERQEKASYNLKNEFLNNPQYDKHFILPTSMNEIADENIYNVTEPEFAGIIFPITKLLFYLLSSKFIIRL